MNFLLLGRGKTGHLAADVAHDRGHIVRVIGENENQDGSALTAAMLAPFDAVIDFTNPQAAAANMKACLSNGAHIVVGTTGWYDKLGEMRAICHKMNAGLVYGANFSSGVQELYRLAEELARSPQVRDVSVTETHHTGKKDAPSGTALVLREILCAANPALDVKITSRREGDSIGLHVITARSASEVIEIKHEALSRRSFAEGAVRAAEWIAGKPGCYEFREIYQHLR